MQRLLGNLLLITTLVWTNVVCACVVDLSSKKEPSSTAHAHHEMSVSAPCDHQACDNCAAISAAQIVEHKLVCPTKLFIDIELEDDSSLQSVSETSALLVPLPGTDPPGQILLVRIADTPITRHDTLLE